MIDNRSRYRQDKSRSSGSQSKMTKSSEITVIQLLRSLVEAVIELPRYIYWIIRWFLVYFYYFLSSLRIGVIGLKGQLVRRMFWGRGGLYRSSFHLLIIVTASFVLFSNVASRFALAQTEQGADLVFSYASAGNNDVLQQGNSLKSIVAIDPGFPEFTVKTYIVQDGDDLDDIAKDFGVSKDTIKWANSKILSPFNDDIEAGWKLEIPEMDGVLYTVERGDTFDGIVDKTGGDTASIVELNRLSKSGDSYKVAEGQRLFIPDGELKPPEPPRATSYATRYPSYNGASYNEAKAALDSMPAGTFGNPLNSSACGGYKYIRGLTAYHNGVDLAKRGGCPISAAAAGTVYFAGWHYLSGFHVMLDHGSGIRTHYFHAQKGTLRVAQGQRVSKGQELMYMGCTGRCTGTHLHFELYVGGRYMDPGAYVPY